jgi:hypothetical protein
MNDPPLKNFICLGEPMKSRLGRILLVILLGLTLAAGSSAALADSLVLSDVPEYVWYHGCSPTSGGMLMGYWAEHGYVGLLPGVADPMVQSQAVNDIISSAAHNASNTWEGHPADCIADYMHTANAATQGQNVALGLSGWTTSVGLSAQVDYRAVHLQGGSFSYITYKNEIDAGRPMLLNLLTLVSDDSKGHTVLAYGYQDDMFNLQVRIGTGYQNITVPGFAVMDTWKNGAGVGAHAEWEDWSGNPVYPIIIDGVEWWPFLDASLTFGSDYAYIYDWEIYSGVLYQIDGDPAPVPPTLVLLGSGILVLLRRRPKMG